jgi:hypothetical protein
MSSCSAILIIWHLGRVIPTSEAFFFFYQGGKKSFIKQTGTAQEHVQKGLQECLYLKYFGISIQLVYYYINSFKYENYKKKKPPLITMNQ